MFTNSPESLVLHSVHKIPVAFGSDEFVESRSVSLDERFVGFDVEIDGFFAEIFGGESSRVFLHFVYFPNRVLRLRPHLSATSFLLRPCKNKAIARRRVLSLNKT